MKPFLYFVLPLMCILALAACSPPEGSVPAEAPAPEEPEAAAEMLTLSGEAFYRERIALPPGAVFTVVLEDVSRMDVASTVIAETSRELDSAPPYAFELSYDAAEIDERMRYNVRAKIMVEDRLRFTSTENVDPFAEGDEPLRIMMSSVAGSPAPSAGAGEAGDLESIVSVDPLAEMENTHWKVLTLGGQAVTMTENQEREAFLMLQSEEGTATGFSSCNSFNGAYRIDGNDLEFGPLAATQRACMEGMDVEQAFFKALAATRHYSIQEESLTLFGEDKQPLATFAAVYF